MTSVPQTKVGDSNDTKDFDSLYFRRKFDRIEILFNRRLYSNTFSNLILLSDYRAVKIRIVKLK